MDNEPGLHLLHNHGVFQRFVDHLRHTYGDVETLNREWGLVYWSHRLSHVGGPVDARRQRAAAVRPGLAPVPGALTTEMIDWQARAVRALARPDQFVTTCIAYDRPALDDADLAAVLDVTSGNAYYGMQDGLAHPSTSTRRRSTGPRTARGRCSRSGDAMFSSRGEPFLVTETNAQAIGGPSTNNPAYPGQWRQAAWALVSRGARMVEYWHWHTLHYGAETYWGGVLPHSGRPRAGPTASWPVLGAELARVGGALADAVPDADIAILSSTESRFALAAQPPLQRADGTGDPNSYPRIVARLLPGRVRRRAPGARGAPAPPVRATTRPTSSAPTPCSSRPATTRRPTPTSTGCAGTPRPAGTWSSGRAPGTRTTRARARAEVQPARLSDAGRAPGTRSSATSTSRSRCADRSPLAGRGGTAWAECLVADGADVLATYEHPHLGAWAAVTTRAYGAGRVTVVGTVPDLELARSLAALAGPVAARRVGRPAAERHRPQLDPTGRQPRPRRPQLVLGGRHRDCSDRSRSSRRTARRRTRGPATRGRGRSDRGAGRHAHLGSWDVLVAVTR